MSVATLRVRAREDSDRPNVERFRLAALHAGAVDDSRARLKPEIPRVGEHGIDLHDELVLEKVLGG